MKIKQFHSPVNFLTLKSVEMTTTPTRRFISQTESLVARQATKLVSSENAQHGYDDTAYKYSKPKPLLQRPLGGLEIMYHHTLAKGTDMIWLLTKVNTVFPVTAAMSQKALYFLAQEHPLLRMTIQCNADDICFLEMDDLKLDFSESNRTDWLQLVSEEVSIPFDIVNGPLWKCRLLKPARDDDLEHKIGDSDDLVHESSFLFLLHHSMMDGRYVVCLFKQFVETLNKISLGILSTNTQLAVPLLPPVEDVLLCPTDQPRTSDISNLESSSSMIRADFSDPPNNVLEDYNHRFYREIQDSWSEHPRNQCLVFEFTEHDTSQMIQACKEVGTSPSGVFVAASILSFTDLVYPSSSLQKSFSIPFEFMLDLRRFCPREFSGKAIHCLPGVASAPIPMIADLQLSQRPVMKSEFWEMSMSFGKVTGNEIRSPETFSSILNTIKESKNLNKVENTNGKSSYVLCISNMGCLDGVVVDDITKRARLSEIHGHSSILIEDSPIFYICFYSLNGKLYVNISFCENYTSAKTTQEYMKYFKEYILSLPKNSDY